MADSVFYDLAETPQEAANLTARGLLMIAIERRIGKKVGRRPKPPRVFT